MKMNKIFLSFLFITSVQSADFGIAMPDQITEDFVKDNKNLPSPHVQGDRSGKIEKLEGDAPRIPDMTKIQDQKLNFKSKILGNSSTAPYDYEDRPSQIKVNSKEIFDKIYDKGRSNFGFSYVQDTYDIADSRGAFDTTFERSSESIRGGTLHFEMDKNLYKGFIDLNYGLGIGVGFSQGNGSFSSASGEESTARFLLYTIPVDLRLGIDILENRFFKLSLNGGPSIMGLYQSRSDKDDGDFGKKFRQYSLGYFGQAKLKISMASISKKIITDNFVSQDVTNMYLDIQARVQSFEKFQDDLTITGSSFGVGFSFDYL